MSQEQEQEQVQVSQEQEQEQEQVQEQGAERRPLGSSSGSGEEVALDVGSRGCPSVGLLQPHSAEPCPTAVAGLTRAERMEAQLATLMELGKYKVVVVVVEQAVGRKEVHE